MSVQGLAMRLMVRCNTFNLWSVRRCDQRVSNQHFNDITKNPWESPNNGSESCQVLLKWHSQHLPMTIYNYNTCTFIFVVIITSGYKSYTFETSRQALTSIDTTILTPIAHCSLFTVNPLLSIALCLQFWVAHC